MYRYRLFQTSGWLPRNCMSHFIICSMIYRWKFSDIWQFWNIPLTTRSLIWPSTNGHMFNVPFICTWLALCHFIDCHIYWCIICIWPWRINAVWNIDFVLILVTPPPPPPPKKKKKKKKNTKSFVLWFELYWSLFLMVQLTIFQNWFR